MRSHVIFLAFLFRSFPSLQTDAEPCQPPTGVIFTGLARWRHVLKDVTR